MMRGPPAMVTVAVFMASPAMLLLLEKTGMTLPPLITSPWRSPKPGLYVVPLMTLAWVWLPGIGSIVMTWLTISSVAVLGVLKKVLGLKVAPPSRLALNELAAREVP